jgi:hypothetical protein
MEVARVRGLQPFLSFLSLAVILTPLEAAHKIPGLPQGIFLSASFWLNSGLHFWHKQQLFTCIPFHRILDSLSHSRKPLSFDSIICFCRNSITIFLKFNHPSACPKTLLIHDDGNNGRRRSSASRA